MIILEKWIPKKPLSVVYFDSNKEKYFAKRFIVENENREEVFISNSKGSFLELISTDWKPVIEVVFNKIRNKEPKPNLRIVFDEFISVKGIKAQGNQLTPHKVKQVNLLEPLKYIPPVEKPANEIEVVDENVLIDNSEGDEATAQTSLF